MKRLVTVALVAALAATGVAAGLHVTGADSSQGSAPVATAPSNAANNATAPAIEPAATTSPAPRAPKRLKLWKFDAPVVPVGCYLIVEDSNIGRIRKDLMPGPLQAVETFLASTDEFVVDREREKFLITFNPSGYLRRVR